MSGLRDLRPEDLIAAERDALIRLADQPAVNSRFGWRIRGERRALADTVLARLIGMGLGAVEPLVIRPRSPFRARRHTHRIVPTERGRRFAAALRKAAGS